MKVFEKGDKVNFVDENNVFLGYDLSQDCCENAGYLITKTIPNKLEANDEILNTDAYNFDTKFQGEALMGEDLDSGGSRCFRLISKEDTNDHIFVTIYNSHNGYYGHGFEFKIRGEEKDGGYL
jgi:hypothetical protein